MIFDVRLGESIGLSLTVWGLVWVIVALVLATVAIVLTWRLVYSWISSIYRRIDDVIPGDLSEYSDDTSRVISLFLSAVILSGAGLAIAGQLGMDIGGVLDLLGGWGRATLGWLLPRLLRILLIVGVALLVLRVLGRVIPVAIRRYLEQRIHAETEAGEIDKRANTLEAVIKHGLTWMVALAAGFVILSELGVNLTPLLAGAGVAGIAIGFGAQSLVRDFIAGLFILLEDQYRVGDVVIIAGTGGLVENIDLRRTVLRDLDYTRHIIPNGEVRISSNMTKDKSRVNLNISVAYKEDLDKVMEVLTRVGKEMKEDPYFGPLIIDPIKSLRVDSFGDSGIDIKVLGEVQPIRQWEVGGEYKRRVKKAFDEAGIEIPFPHRTLNWGQDVETLLRHMPNAPQKGPDANSKDSP